MTEPTVKDTILEQVIKRRCDDVIRLNGLGWKGEARRAAADVADLIALRTPETVARMEQERGLA